MNNDYEFMNVTQACRKYGVCRQSIFICIYNNRLKAKKVNGRWWFTVKDWNDYLSSKYHRKFSMKDGKKIYDIEKGIMSTSMIAHHFALDKQQIYYLLRKGVIPYKKSGSSYVILREDVSNALHKKNQE
jgi:hypothetical protein